MKKIAVTVLAFILMLTIGCASDTGKQAVEQCKMSIAAGDYDKAFSYLKLAQEENCTDEYTKDMSVILEKYLSARDLLAEHKISEALESFNSIPDSYKKYQIADAVEALRLEIENKQKLSGNVDEQIAAVSKWISTGDYASAKANIDELYTKDMDARQKARVDELKATIDTVQSKFGVVTGNTNVIDTYYVVNCRESITLRDSASYDGKEITQIPLGRPVGYIEDVGNGFYKINYDGLVGYSLAEYLSKSKNGGEMRRYARVVNCKDWITLREQPNYNSSLARIPLGASVIYLGSTSSEFCYIEYNGMRGYVLKTYIEVW